MQYPELKWSCISDITRSVSLFIIGAYEYKDDEEIPPILLWLFKPDCMDLIFYVVCSLSIPHPQYTRTEIVVLSRHPPAAAYRLLVSATVISSGLRKASLGCWGSSTSMSWVDWMQTIPIARQTYLLLI